MLLYDAAHNGQPQPGAALLACVRSIHLLESLENGLELILRNSAAVILNAKHHIGTTTLRGKFYATTSRRKFDGVSQKVDESLHETFLISIDRSGTRRHRDRHPLAFSEQAHRLGGVFHQSNHIAQP